MQVETKKREKSVSWRADCEYSDTHTHTLGLDVVLMSLVCGYGIQPDGLLALTDGSSVGSHHFLPRTFTSSSESCT